MTKRAEIKRRQESSRLLERMIAFASPKSDAREIAGRLLRQYGSLAPLLEAKPEDLCETEGVTRSLAVTLNLMPQLTRYLERARTREMTKQNTLAAAGEFLRALYIGEHYEHVFALCLDGAGRLLDCALIQTGTVDEAPFYLRHLMEATARSGARAVVLSHNHPSGTAYASRADVETTLRAMAALNSMGVILLDHVIVADGGYVSMRELGSLPQALVLAQERGSALIENWLAGETARDADSPPRRSGERQTERRNQTAP